VRAHSLRILLAGLQLGKLCGKRGSGYLSYDCVVCVKQVPDTANVTGEAMKADGTVNRAALPAIFNPEDLHALEAALRVRDIHGGTVTAISMGPPAACDILRDCLYRGADRVILVTDRRAAASDTLATSYILSRAVKALGKFDLVFCGRQAIDGDTAQVGPQMAEKLGIPQITYLEQIVELAGRSVRARRNVGNGWEVVECRLPVLMTVLDTANEPRPAAARRMMRYKRARTPAEIVAEVAQSTPDAPADEQAAETARRVADLTSRKLLIEQWHLDDICADLAWCGMSGSPTKVHRIQSIVLKKEGYTEIPATQEGVRGMVHELIVDRTLG
jgi:electron transfer flavoprotein beta subunit